MVEDNNNTNNANLPSTTSTNNNNVDKEIITYNTKWNGYLYIMLSSLVNFSSVADVSVDNLDSILIKNENLESIFGAISFLITFCIILFDRIHALQRKFDFKNVKDGKLEGGVLISLVIWWIVGVGIMTRAGGIAYTMLNSYFSCWYTLVVSIYTLNQWMSEKDIISIHELTRLSETLSYWYILFFASLIEMGSAADVYTHVSPNNVDAPMNRKREYSIAVGALSTFVSVIAILAHYKLICCCNLKPGGMIEIVVGILLCIWWILSVAILTTDQQIASTIQGVMPYPGSNLYLSLWLGLYGSVNICLKWKAVNAMKQMSNVTLQRIRIDGGHRLPSDDEEDVE
jgi:hypothetical protein